MQRITAFSAFFLLAIGLKAQSLDDFFQQADRFFNRYVSEGKVYYEGVKDNPAGLKELTAQIANMDLSATSAVEKKAFYINAYNLTVIQAITAHYPIASPMDAEGFFDQAKHSVAGEVLTLNDIENKKIRAVYDDPRIHFVLVCAAMGCPEIVNHAYHPEKLDRQLEERTRKTMNDPYFIRLKPESETVAVSQIFDWYKEDFKPIGILDFINRYREEKIPSGYRLSYYTYDWALNEKKK